MNNAIEKDTVATLGYHGELMAKINLIESLHSTKRMTIRYKGLKIRLFN